MRRLIACLLLLVLPVLAACSNNEPAAAPAPAVKLKDGLTWTGSEIAGVKYFARRTGRATVHYALPTMPETAELMVTRATTFYANQEKMARAPLLGHVDIWIVPPTHKWPEGAPEPTRGMLAPAPGVVIMRDFIGALYVPKTATVLPQLDYYVAVAAYEPAGSPIYAQEWLQVGMGMIRTEEWNYFPQQFWGAGSNRSGSQLLTDAGESNQYQFGAWVLFSAMLFDRFGFGWASYYEGDPADLTPEAALKWAMGTDDVNAALARLGNRMASARGQAGTVPDLSPERMKPVLTQLPPGPGPNPNYSPQSYEISAELDAGRMMLTGDMRLTWQNGEGIPLDALYFNLWANAERHRMYGGSIDVKRVTVDGRPAGFEAKGMDLKVDLGGQVLPGRQVEVAIQFATHLTANLNDGLGLREGAVFYLSQFYPILGVLDDRGWNLHALSYTGGDPYSEQADYKVSLTVPAGFVVGGAGRQVGRTDNGGSWTYRYEASQLPEWSAVGGKDWVESTAVVGGTTVRLLNEDPLWRERVMPAAVETLGFLQEQLGPFPLPQFVVVRGNLKLPGIGSASDTDSGGWYINGLANSMANQWFGTYVGNDQWTEAWLDEGLSKYMEREAARALGREYQAVGVRLIDRPRHGRVTQNGMDFLLTRDWDLMAGTYAANFFEALEEQIGSAAMNGLVRRWLREYGGRTGTGADLVRLAEDATGPLEPFLEEHAIDLSRRQPYARIVVPGYGP